MASKLENYVNGEFVAPMMRKYISNMNPSTDKRNNLVPDSDVKDVNGAVAAAKRAFPAWKALDFSERAVFLDKIVQEMKKPENFAALVKADGQDMGKPAGMAEGDIGAAIAQFETMSRLIQASTTPYYQKNAYISLEHRDPIGVVGLISPWNFPCMIFCTKVAAALACGNCVVAKPSEISPTSAYLMCRIFAAAGVPAGVVNVVHGLGARAGEPLVSHPDVGAISFTGGTVTGKRISGIAAPMLKKLQLELGGKNPAMVFADCYLEETVAGIAMSEFWNTGQVCCSGSRLIVERKIADRFVEALAKFVKANYTANIGAAGDEGVVLGPLSSKGHFEKVKGYLELLEKEGGKVVLGGGWQEHGRGQRGFRLNKRYDGTDTVNGYFVEPTIVVGMAEDARCVKEEIFGPVLSVHTFETEEEAIRLANNTTYGLAANVWTSDIRRGQRVARALEAGTVWINNYGEGDARQPFGGFKNSGVGRENGMHSIDFFSEMKAIVSKL